MEQQEQQEKIDECKRRIKKLRSAIDAAGERWDRIYRSHQVLFDEAKKKFNELSSLYSSYESLCKENHDATEREEEGDFSSIMTDDSVALLSKTLERVQNMDKTLEEIIKTENELGSIFLKKNELYSKVNMRTGDTLYDELDSEFYGEIERLKTLIISLENSPSQHERDNAFLMDNKKEDDMRVFLLKMKAQLGVGAKILDELEAEYKEKDESAS